MMQPRPILRPRHYAKSRRLPMYILTVPKWTAEVDRSSLDDSATIRATLGLSGVSYSVQVVPGKFRSRFRRHH